MLWRYTSNVTGTLATWGVEDVNTKRYVVLDLNHQKDGWYISQWKSLKGRDTLVWGSARGGGRDGLGEVAASNSVIIFV